MKNTNSDAYINQLDASKDKYITIAYSDITHNGVHRITSYNVCYTKLLRF